MGQKSLAYLTILDFSSQSMALGPAVTSQCAPLKGHVYYTVQSGDRIAGIARTFGLTPLWN
jgi:hypothetical protein